jgi:hypothetical protein
VLQRNWHGKHVSRDIDWKYISESKEFTVDYGSVAQETTFAPSRLLSKIVAA